MALDVTDEANWQHAVAATVGRFGKLDVLVNNAGISGRPTVMETTGELWDRVMDINAKGVFLGTKAAIPEMRKVGGRLHNQYILDMGHGWQRYIRQEFTPGQKW